MISNRPILLLGTVLLLALGALLALQFAPSSSGEDGASLVDLRDTVRRLEGEMAAMREERDSISRELSALRATEAGRAPQRTQDLNALVAAAIEEYLAEHPEAAAAAAENGAGAQGLAMQDLNGLLEDTVSQLTDPRLSPGKRDALWKEIQEAGMVEEVIAALEDEVEARPNDLDLKVQLGNAYLQPILLGEASLSERGGWAMKADAVYDEVLEANPRHWQARFEKAVALAHWPPIMGKRPEAIRHFETLIEQQQYMAPEPRHAEAYFLLGNLHEQSGNAEQARAAWQKGLAAFPGDEALRGALGED